MPEQRVQKAEVGYGRLHPVPPESIVLRMDTEERYRLNHLERMEGSFAAIAPVKPGCSVLSVGSWGNESQRLKEMGAGDFVCIRGPEPGLPPVSTDNGITTHAFDVEGEWTDVGKFDLVLLWEILEHLNREPTRVLWNAIRATKLGGVLSLTTPNALWHPITIANVFGQNALGLKLQPHIPFATHWRLWSPAEVAECFREMGCEIIHVGSYVKEKPFPTLKSRLAVRLLEFLRRRSGNGKCTVGQHVLVTARKVSEPQECYRPEWLFPRTGQ